MKTLYVDEQKFVDWFFGDEDKRTWGYEVWEQLSSYGKYKIDVQDLWDRCEDIPANAILNRPKWWAENNYLDDVPKDNMPDDFWDTFDFELVRKGTLGYPTEKELANDS